MNENRTARLARCARVKQTRRSRAILRETEPGEGRHLEFKNVLVPVDFAPATLRELRYAVRIADSSLWLDMHGGAEPEPMAPPVRLHLGYPRLAA